MNSNSSAGTSQQPQPPPEPTGVIYLIRNKINGKGYVGKTRQKLEARMAQHRYNASRGRSAVEVAIQKYGWENFTVEILEECPVSLLNEREIYYIKEFGTKAPNGYNLTDGGDGGLNPSADVSGERSPFYGKHHSPETLARMSAAQKAAWARKKGQKHSPEHCANLAAAIKAWWARKKALDPNYGKRTPEACAKMVAAHKGKPSPLRGRKLPDDVRAKISVAKKGKPSPMKGKKQSPETLAKKSAAMKAWWARKKALENGGGE